MKCKSLHVALMVFLCLAVKGVNAQQATVASGGNSSGTGGSVSYSVGQIVYDSFFGSNDTVSQGVQQPYEISVVNEIISFKDILLQCSAFPNPAKDILNLTVGDYKFDNLTYYLFDSNGKLLQSKRIESNLTTISMSLLAPSSYFLKVMEGNSVLKTFKIIKM